MAADHDRECDLHTLRNMIKEAEPQGDASMESSTTYPVWALSDLKTISPIDTLRFDLSAMVRRRIDGLGAWRYNNHVMAEALKSQGSVTYTISLPAWLKRDGRQWIACCPSVDVLTQSSNKVAAKKALREAVSLWFESCIDRDVLEEALLEAGFKKAKDGLKPPSGVGRVTVQQNQAKQEEMANIEVSIPAFIAARMSNNDGHATC